MYAALLGLALALPLVQLHERQPPAGDQQQATRIDVGIVQDDPLLQAPMLQEVLAGHLAGTGAQVEVRTMPRGDLIDHVEWAEAIGPDRSAVYLIELLPTGVRRMYLYQPNSGALWVRELPRADDADLLLESLGAMVRGTTVGLAEGPPRGMEAAERPRRLEPEPKTEPKPEPAPKTAAPPPEPVRPIVTVALAYAGGNLEASAPWQSGGSVAVDVELRSSAWILADASLLAPAKLDGAPTFDVWRIPILLAAGYRFRRDRAVRPALGAGVVIEPFTWQAETDASVQGNSGRTARVGLAPTADLRFRFARGFGAHLRARADVWLLNAELVVQDGADRRSRFHPHPVGALVHAGLHYSF